MHGLRSAGEAGIAAHQHDGARHLLECGAQVCGGYFADPGYKDVPQMAAIGLPLKPNSMPSQARPTLR